jgi:dihydrodipicolinate synthase/N-acetylneuraminate lyase
VHYEKVRGVIVPILTPFTAEGQVDREAAGALVDHLVKHGVSGLFPLGTTGEGPLLTTQERKAFAQTVLDAASGRVPVIIHTGAITSAETVELSRHAQEIGAYAGAIIPPYFFGISDAGLISYYTDVASQVPEFPLYLYDNPGVTHNHLTQEIVFAVVEATDNVIGLKDSSGSLEKLFAARALRDGAFNTAIGPDGLIGASVAMGIDASVSGNANVVPELVVALYNAASSYDMETAQILQARLNVVREILRDGRDMSMFKGVLAQRGIPVGQVRSPLVVAEKERFEQGWQTIEQILSDLRSNNLIA